MPDAIKIGSLELKRNGQISENKEIKKLVFFLLNLIHHRNQIAFLPNEIIFIILEMANICIERQYTIIGSSSVKFSCRLYDSTALFSTISDIEDGAFRRLIISEKEDTYTLQSDEEGHYTLTGILPWAEVTQTDSSEIIVTSVPATRIGERLFSNLNHLKKTVEKIVLPDGVEVIGDEAFMECTALKDLSLPSSLVSMGSGLFQLCVKLQRLKLPEKITCLQKSAFMACLELEKVTLPPQLNAIHDKVFFGCKKLKEISIPESVTSIGEQAFMGCASMKSIDLGDNIAVIQKKTLMNCQSLNHISLPNNLTGIDDHAFENCTSMTTFELPQSVKSIGIRAFSGCTMLETVVLPEDYDSIGDHAFRGCRSLRLIVCSERNEIHLRSNRSKYGLSKRVKFSRSITEEVREKSCCCFM